MGSEETQDENVVGTGGDESDDNVNDVEEDLAGDENLAGGEDAFGGEDPAVDGADSQAS